MVRQALAQPRRVVAAALLAAVVSLVYLAGHFSVRTDLDALISRDLPWRHTETALETAFVSQGEDLTLVVEGATPELADHVANQLAERLAQRTDVFLVVQRPDGGPWLEKQALLFQPLDEVRQSTARLIEAQPLIGPVAADPSLRGVATAVETSLTDAETDPRRLERLQPVFGALDKALADVATGRSTPLSWRQLVTGETPSPGDRRRIVALTPRMNYDLVEPARPALAAVAEAEQALGIRNGHGPDADVKVTGSVAMETEELRNLGEATGPIAIFCMALMLGVLFWGVRSMKVIAAIAVTVLTGLALTASVGLLMFERFTLVSVAFLPLFVGLGIDFAIQFAIRYRSEALTQDHDTALLATGRIAGPGVGLAAAATGFGFLAFFPTPYKGVSELGMIAGVGMLIGAVFALTVLPALLKLLNAGAASSDEDTERFDRLYRIAESRRRPLLTGAAVAVLAGLAVLPLLRFDFDAISLRSTHDVSVKTFLELTHDPDLTPNRLQALASSPAEAEALAARLRKLQAVRNVYTVNSLVPQDQDAKLSIIRDASLLLDTTLSPFDVAPAPTDDEISRTLARASKRLSNVAGRKSGQGAETARRLAERMQALSTGSAELRARATRVLTGSLEPALDQVRATLAAEPVTVDTLPAELRREWISAKGEARVDISPAGDPADPANLARFIAAVRSVIPAVSGPPVAVVEAGRTILGAFIEAGVLSTLAIGLMLAFVLRRATDVLLTLAPVVATLVLTLATLAATRQPINLENLIALPLLLGIGVSFNIYTVIAWRDGANREARASLSHAILFSALTTGASFLALALSAHPGTASLGRLLLITLGWTLAGALFLQPALLASIRRR